MGSVGFLTDFEVYIGVSEVGRGPIGLVAPLRFKMLDYQTEKLNMGLVSIDFPDIGHFRKSFHGFLARYSPCCRPGRPKVRFSSFSVGTKKLCSEKSCRFVVVSPREVPSVYFSMPI